MGECHGSGIPPCLSCAAGLLEGRTLNCSKGQLLAEAPLLTTIAVAIPLMNVGTVIPTFAIDIETLAAIDVDDAVAAPAGRLNSPSLIIS